MFLNGDIAKTITKIKQQAGPDLHVYGSANLVQTLLKHDLVDANHGSGLFKRHRDDPLDDLIG